MDDQSGPATKYLIVEAAIALFREKGYHATSMRDIAKSAGISLGSLYYHFPAKHGILEHVVVRSATNSRPAYQAIATSSLPIEERLRQLLRRQIVDTVEGQDVSWVFAFERRFLPPAVLAGIREMTEHFQVLVQQVIAEGVEAGIMTVAEPKLVARHIVQLCNAAGLTFRRNGRLSAEEIADKAVNLALNGVMARDRGTSIDK